MVFKYWVKNIQTAAYNGARTVTIFIVDFGQVNKTDRNDALNSFVA